MSEELLMRFRRLQMQVAGLESKITDSLEPLTFEQILDAFAEVDEEFDIIFSGIFQELGCEQRGAEGVSASVADESPKLS